MFDISKTLRKLFLDLSKNIFVYMEICSAAPLDCVCLFPQGPAVAHDPENSFTKIARQAMRGHVVVTFCVYGYFLSSEFVDISRHGVGIRGHRPKFKCLSFSGHSTSGFATAQALLVSLSSELGLGTEPKRRYASSLYITLRELFLDRSR